ncbi:unnamed protein product [Ectocarpus sp. 4 AP-2014]
MSRFLNPIGAASAAMRTPARRRVVQKVLDHASTAMCEREFMMLMNALPEGVEDTKEPAKMETLRTAQKSLQVATQKAAAHRGQDYVTFRMKQLSGVAATKKRRRRNGIGRGRFNLARVY